MSKGQKHEKEQTAAAAASGENREKGREEREREREGRTHGTAEGENEGRSARAQMWQIVGARTLAPLRNRARKRRRERLQRAARCKCMCGQHINTAPRDTWWQYVTRVTGRRTYPGYVRQSIALILALCVPPAVRASAELRALHRPRRARARRPLLRLPSCLALWNTLFCLRKAFFCPLVYLRWARFYNAVLAFPFSFLINFQRCFFFFNRFYETLKGIVISGERIF